MAGRSVRWFRPRSHLVYFDIVGWVENHDPRDAIPQLMRIGLEKPKGDEPVADYAPWMSTEAERKAARLSGTMRDIEDVLAPYSRPFESVAECLTRLVQELDYLREWKKKHSTS